MAAGRLDTVAAYVASLDEPKRATVAAILAVIARDFPEATVKLAWNVPQVQIGGKYVFGLAAYKHHVSLSPWSAQVMQDFAPRLAQFETRPGMFHVAVDWPVDDALLRDLVAARLAELGMARLPAPKGP